MFIYFVSLLYSFHCASYSALSDRDITRTVSVGQHFVATAWVRFPAGQDYSLLHRVQNGSGAHQAFYPIGTGCKAAGA
jgi:hypothetical protein